MMRKQVARRKIAFFEVSRNRAWWDKTPQLLLTSFTVDCYRIQPGAIDKHQIWESVAYILKAANNDAKYMEWNLDPYRLFFWWHGYPVDSSKDYILIF